MSAYLVTGATGFLGGYVVRELSRHGGTIYALARDPEKAAKLNLPVTWVEGDLTDPGVIRSPETKAKVRAEVTQVIHLAAVYDLEASHEDLYLANIVGTHHLIHLVSQFEKVEAFHHASTMAVAGDYPGKFTEEMFAEGQSFPNVYASTKFASEASIREWRTDIAKYIYRFGILVGDSATGFINKVDGPYYLMKAIRKSQRLGGLVKQLGFVTLPFNEHTRLYFVPVDIAAVAMVTVVENGPKVKGLRVYHVMGQSGGIPIRSVLKKILLSHGVKAHLLSLPDNPLIPAASKRLGIPAETLYYMYTPGQFGTDRITHDFPEVKFPRFEDYADVILDYASQKLLVEGHA